MIIRILFYICTLTIVSHSLACKSSPEDAAKKNGNANQLIWADEFDKDGLPNAQFWNYDLGDACELPAGCGWGNNELQYYTNKSKNARVKDGFLIIEAHQEKIENSAYSSARLIGKNKKDFQYGRIEVRAQLPSGLGTWPAIWMLPQSDKYGGWPRCGEIDIMEHVGYQRDSIFGTVHTKAFNGMIGTQKTKAIYIPDAETTFHTYSIEWTPEKIEWFVDDQHYNTFERVKGDIDKWPFDQKFHMILNLAVGGNWGGKFGIDDSIWPQRMLVDYVRVYKN